MVGGSGGACAPAGFMEVTSSTATTTSARSSSPLTISPSLRSIAVPDRLPTRLPRSPSVRRALGRSLPDGDRADDQILRAIPGRVDGEIPPPGVREARVGDPDRVRHPSLADLYPLPRGEPVAAGGVVGGVGSE